MTLDLRAVQETLDWHDAHELTITQLRALLAHCRALREALASFVRTDAIEMIASPELQTRKRRVCYVSIEEWERAAAVLAQAQDGLA